MKEPIDMDWIKEQLTNKKPKKVVGDSVIKLMEAWNKLPDASEENKRAILDIFSKLSLSHSIVPQNPDERWIPAQAGQLIVGDTIRVRSDAFSGANGVLHNGRRGKIVGVRYGDIIVKTTDGKVPVLDGTHYPPNLLEKLFV